MLIVRRLRYDFSSPLNRVTKKLNLSRVMLRELLYLLFLEWSCSWEFKLTPHS